MNLLEISMNQNQKILVVQVPQSVRYACGRTVTFDLDDMRANLR